MYNSFIYGSSPLERVVSCEVSNDTVTLFLQDIDGRIETKELPYKHWLLSCKQKDESWMPLEGDQYYKYIKFFDSKSALWNARTGDKKDYWKPYDDKESAMQISGFTYYKGLKLSEVSVLAFDIEATGLEHNRDSKVLLISNTFRCGDHIEKRLFSYDEYPTQGKMLIAWANWVRSMNPSIILGHNIYGYDLPYMAYCGLKDGVELRLGRDGSAIKFDDYESKFRKDGSQFLHYHNASIYGREVIDTMHLSIKYDAAARKYESYALKKIITQEGLERVGRQHYDASKISRNYKDPSEWSKIKDYARDDADDALALWDRMGSAYFYLARAIPKSFQSIINGATGSQLNSFLVRSYLSIGHSIPQASEAVEFEGAISIGNPGVYRNVFKVDVASLYPSIMMEYKIYDREKDPLAHLQQTVKFFTEERLANKARAKETGDRYYKDVEQAQKIVINSLYGLLGASGLNFNSPSNGALVTRHGRDILGTAMKWADELGFKLVNADTDSIAICGSTITINDSNRKELLSYINKLFPSGIKWEDDGLYDSVLVLKAKNYVLKNAGQVKMKGSALKATLKEKALKEFITRMLDSLLNQDGQTLSIYNQYVKEILTLKDITRWSSKKTITDKVMNPQRENEAKVYRALSGSNYVEGDKVYMYFTKDDELKLQENWNGDHCPIRLLEKLHSTLLVFETVLDVKQFPNYSLKRNQKLLQGCAA